MLKHLNAKIIFLGLAFLATPVIAGKMTPRQALYYHAERGNRAALFQLQQMGYPIDVSDEYGNSALCEAVIKNNRTAIQTLIQMGADTHADCMQTLSVNAIPNNPTVPAAIFSGEVNQKENLASKDLNNIPNPPAEPLSKNSKVGIGVGVTTALIAGGVTAALVGGGGGSSTPHLNCVNGTQVGSVCQCDEHATGKLCDQCESGYDFHGTTTCHETQNCKKNSHQVGDVCQCNEGYNFETPEACYQNLCSQYQHMHPSKNEQDQDVCVCDEGYDFQGETGCYEEKNCTVPNTIQRNDACVCKSDYPVATYNDDGTIASCTACGTNMSYVGNECVCKSGFPFKDDTGCYAKKDCHHGEQQGNRCICEPGRSTEDECTTCIAGFAEVNGKCIKVVLEAEKNTNTSEAGLVYTNIDTDENPAHDADIVGLYSSDKAVVNALPDSENGATRKITITNEGKGAVYGLFSNKEAYGTYNSSSRTSSSIITIKNTGGDTYGIYGTQEAYGVKNGKTARASSTLNINTSTNENKVYGIYSSNKDAYHVYDDTTTSGSQYSSATLSIHNSLGTSYGIYSAKGIAYGAYDTGKYTEDGSTKARSVSSIINLYQWGGTAYGMRGALIRSTDTNENFNNKVENTINMQLIGREKIDTSGNITLGKAIGMRSLSGGIYNTKTGVININLIGGNYKKGTTDSAPSESVTVDMVDDTAAIGIYADSNISVTNAGAINITRSNWTDTEGFSEDTKNITYEPGKTGKAFGIYVVGNSSSRQVIKNTGTITIEGDYDEAYGIYVDNGKNVDVENSGTIIVTSPEGYGIYFNNGTGGTVKNSGTIKAGDDDDCEGEACYGSFHALVENGATAQQTQKTETTSLNLNKMAGTVVAQSGSTFAAKDTIFGTLHIDTDVVTKGFNSTYTEKDMIQAQDTKNLQLISDSALFNASLNGNDVVMTKKNFNDLIKNHNLADFLEKNYTLGNNEAFYNKLKAFNSTHSLTNSLNKLTGKEMLSRFNFEDMTMMRELNFDMNEKLFHNNEQHFALSGSINPMAFKGDTGSNARYSLYNKHEGNKSIGLGIAFTDIRSDDNHESDDRQESSYQLILPMGYKTNGFDLITSPRIGYARGNYDRTGFDGSTYDGIVEKRVFGLMNEARYPVTIGKWKLEPSAEFNILGYQQKGREEAKEFALNIQNQNTLSVEGGFGLYATREEELDKESSLKLTAGIAAYHEFKDPYRIKVGMHGMDGAFTLRDENRSQNRGVIRAGFDYVYRDLSLYGSLISYIDRETRTSAKTGMTVKF